MPEEFDCSDCGVHVTNLIDGVLPTDRCLGCQFIAEMGISTGADVRLLRARLSVPPHRDPASPNPPAANDGGGASDSAAPGCLS